MSDLLWTSMPLPALIAAATGRVRKVNPACENFLLASARSVEGTILWDRLMIDAPIEEHLARVQETMSPLSVNDVLVSAEGRAPVACTVEVAPYGEDGEALILFAPREHASRVGTSKSARTGARSAIGMAEMLAHEIKNPLAGITGAAQLLSMGISEQDRELTDLIVAESRRIVELLEQVEQFGNLRPPELKAVNVHDVLDRARRSAAVGFGAHMVIEEQYDPSLPHTMADADQLLQVMLNLLKNAAEAQPEGGRIVLKTYYEMSLRVRRADGETASLPLQIAVIDDGPGLPAEIADEVFDPFVSGREAGTGLGLALVSKIVTDHGGWISVDSVPGRTAFRVSLPIAND